ncbi:hypothetical protein RP726_12885 [Candidatus Methylospira mobilis]|uniref:hypothetical protein n=1 Tax=Candidatus Methylospira mobilis TaxID=1808979 RepID=UPI0028ECD055|nr:hypothetical protein [Candidatus Methylospira mobilis]WNV03351.1 hypothetical protein RP726_12885 [Candidatus Methylospira mobilis]
MPQFPVRLAPTPEETTIQPGYRYRVNWSESELAEYLKRAGEADADHHTGVVGAYRPGIDSAQIEAIDLNAQPLNCFVWNTELLTKTMRRGLQSEAEQAPPRHNNRLTLMDSCLGGPEVRLINERTVLSVAPRFELEWTTEAFASQLGCIQLMESSRTLHFSDGEALILLDTEAADDGPVLYLGGTGDTQAVKPVCAFQARGERQKIGYNMEISQLIPAEFQEKAVVSVSVLEKYTCYFLQNAAPSDPERHIWTPVHLPIVWGWSIRVQQRYDGVWDIFRKKLILPTATTEAPALPRWRRNSLQCSTSAAHLLNSTHKATR